MARGNRMESYQNTALSRVREYAQSAGTKDLRHLQGICEPLNIEVLALVDKVLAKPITITITITINFRSGYYDWLGRPPSRRAKRHARILSRIRKVHQKHPTYGLDPIWAEVKESIPCSRGTVYRLMKTHNICSKRKTKWKATTNSKHNLPIAPNLLNQRFDAPLPNTVWVGDITYHWTEEGWLYTAIVKDLCTKEVGLCQVVSGIKFAPKAKLSKNALK